ncbi:MAG: LPS export ABC transporter periplasmic protein LptC [Magnetococcales bacterium]|nr:LPS export ABC transporter periplasmic protein LptC [Magnetococcales bacterium]
MKRSRYARHLFLLLSLLIVASVYWYLKRPYGLQTGGRQALELLAAKQGALVTDIHLTQYDEDRVRWTLDAPSAQRGEEKRILIHHPRLGFAQDDQENIVVTAEEGDVDGATGRMVLTGRVEAGDTEMGRLETELLRFDPEKRMLYTDRVFRLEREQMRLEGQGMTLAQESRTLTVESQVRVTFPDALLSAEKP